MKKFKIEYINYEGRMVYTTVEVEDDQDEGDAQFKAINEDNAFGDGIHQIISCEEQF